MAGLPASGKSSIAQLLTQSLNAVLLNKDVIRACLFNDAIDYTRQQDDLCVNVIYDVARYHLTERPGIPVILDGRSYSRHYQIESVKNTAAGADVSLIIIECVCSSETARQRLENDADTHLAKNRDYSLYQRCMETAETIVEPKLVIDTDNYNTSEGTQLALSYIKSQQACQ